ncbi:hypothetical protein D3C80_1362120 [compost metagenome]
MEDLGQIAWVGQLLPGFHLHHARCGTSDEGAVGGSADFRHLTQQLYVLWAVVEVVIAHQATEGFAAELAVLFLVHFLEDGALVPAHTFMALQRAAQLLLGNDHKADFQHFIGFGVVDQIVQAMPGAFQLLEFGVVDNLVNLLRQFFVDFGDQRLNGAIGVRGDRNGVFQRLLRQGFYRIFYRFLGLIGLGTKLFVQQRAEFIAGESFAGLQRFLLLRRVAHRLVLTLIVVVRGGRFRRIGQGLQ